MFTSGISILCTLAVLVGAQEVVGRIPLPEPDRGLTQTEQFIKANPVPDLPVPASAPAPGTY